MDNANWDKAGRKDAVTVTVFWVLVSSFQSMQESGGSGNKLSIAPSNFLLFCLTPKSGNLGARFLARSTFVTSKRQVQGWLHPGKHLARHTQI